MPDLPDRVDVLLLYGGRSAEHDVSRVSAANVRAALAGDRYSVSLVAIGRDGVWRAVPVDTEPAAPAGGDLGGLPTEGEPVEPTAVLRRDATSPPFVVIPVLHGPYGEDGTLQGLLELAGVAYVGAGVLGSAVAMDKAMAKAVLGAAGIPQTRYRVARRGEMTDPLLDDPLLDDIAADLGYPVFVKPANMGSSVGVSRAVDRAALAEAVRVALRYDDVLVLEEEFVGRELEIGVLGNDEPRSSVPGEILTGADFYDFDDKYRDGIAGTVVPADLEPDVAAEMARLALAAYRALRIEGLSRVDLFHNEARGFVLNEINTFPGFTPISMFPMMWAASGLDGPALLDEMIRLAFERHERRRRLD